jgi:hypothetical protein
LSSFFIALEASEDSSVRFVKLSEKPHERAKRLTIKRVIAT